VESILIDAECKNPLLNQTLLVVEEIFVNIAHYAYKGDDIPGKAVLFASCENKILNLRFEDSGVPFNPLERPEMKLENDIDKRDIGGLGIFIVRKIVDKISYERKDNKNILTIIKKIENLPNPEIRLAGPDDAEAVVELLRKQHGSMHPNEHYYDPEYLRDHIKHKLLNIAIAAVPGNKIAGMSAINRASDFPGSEEVCILIVDPVYRLYNIGSKVNKLALSQVSRDCLSLYAHCMTWNTGAQHIEGRGGLIFTGVLLNSYFYEHKTAFFSGVIHSEKHNLIIGVRPMKKKNAGRLYLPLEYRSFVESVYRELDVGFDIGEAESDTADQASRLEVTQNEKHLYCEGKVYSAGIDFEDRIKELLKTYQNPKQSFNLFINLLHPACGKACSILRKLGFFCAGLEPLAGSCEYLVMHRSLSGLRLPFDDIAVIPQFRDHFEWIKHESTQY
jgi:anti-sigma regulatory factor (Ser/Thr protein kinase)